MDIPVEYEYFLYAVVALDITSAYCDIVEEAESRADFRVARVMSRWSDHAECVVPVLLVHDSVDGLDDCACSDVRGMRWMLVVVRVE